MKILDTLERRFGFLAIHNLTVYLIVGQVLTFAMMALRGNQLEILRHMVFTFDRFASGEVWRIISFLLIPPPAHWIWIAFAWIVFYLMGTALERHWGAFRYTLYLFIGVLGAVIVAAFYPTMPVTNYYIGYSVTFGFAYLYPNFELRIYFILPVKIKWLALIIAVLLLVELINSPTPIRLVILGSLINFPLFFGADLIRSLRAKKRVSERKAEKRKLEAEPFHVCSVCGATDLTNPERDFRYRKEGAICSVCLDKAQNPES